MKCSRVHLPLVDLTVKRRKIKKLFLFEKTKHHFKKNDYNNMRTVKSDFKTPELHNFCGLMYKKHMRWRILTP